MPDRQDFLKAYQDLKTHITNPEQYQAFLETVDRVERKMAELHKPDRQGVLPLLSAEDQDELLRLHVQMGKAAEDAMAGEKNADIKKKLRKLSGLASGNYRALLQYDPKQGSKSLASILEDVRTMTVDASEITLEKRGQAMSSRQVMTIKDPKGNPFSGLFTPKSVLNYMEDNQKVLDKAAPLAQTAEGGLMLRELTEHFRNNMHRIKLNSKVLKKSEDPVQDLARMYQLCADQNGQVTRETMMPLLKIIFRDPKGEKIRDHIGDEALDALAEGMDQQFGKIVINSKEVGIKSGGRVDTRNAAMSAVSDLLGVPTLLARSKPMRISGENGKIIEGTFMAKGDGYDPNNLPEEVANMNGRRISMGGSAMKAVADLQILDYICGNVDRHLDNLVYKFEGEKLVGIQGFDNDASFGLLQLKDGKGFKRLPGTGNMRVISRSMYERVMGMDPAELKFSLRGFELSEEELDAAAQRLTDLQADLKKSADHYREKEAQKKLAQEKKASGKQAEAPEGEDRDGYVIDNDFYEKQEPIDLDPAYMRIIEDDEWEQINPRQLMNPDEKAPKNLFDLVNFRARSLPSKAAMQQEAYKELKSDKELASDTQALQDLPSAQEQKSADMLDKLNRATNWRGSHQPYKDMCKAVDDYKKYQQKLKERIADAQQKVKEGNADYAMKAVVNTEDLMQMEILAHKMADTAQAYVETKTGIDLSGSPYTRKRVNVAMEVQEFALKVTCHTQEEWDLARLNERGATETFNRSMQEQARKLAAGAGPQPGL